MSDADNLTEWLLAQYDADEQTARNAMPGPWFATENELWATPIVCESHWPGLSEAEAKEHGGSAGPPHYVVAQTMQGSCKIADATHIARHDPAVVLADLTTKRRIVELHSGHA